MAWLAASSAVARQSVWIVVLRPCTSAPMFWCSQTKEIVVAGPPAGLSGTDTEALGSFPWDEKLTVNFTLPNPCRGGPIGRVPEGDEADPAQPRVGLSLQAPPRGARAGLARTACHAASPVASGRHGDPRRRRRVEARRAPGAGGHGRFLRAGGR